MAVVGILSDDTDPMVSVMKVEKAPLESYADIGGLESQIQVRRPTAPGHRTWALHCTALAVVS